VLGLCLEKRQSRIWDFKGGVSRLKQVLWGTFLKKSKMVQQNNPLHGVKLEQILVALEAAIGWQEMAIRVPVNCFKSDPSIKSSLKFLRRTPWAREKVEQLYLDVILAK
jgi:uncharacterized protein (DUF2132 family)